MLRADLRADDVPLRSRVDAVFVITIYIAVSKFGDALGVELEPMFEGAKPILHVAH